MGHDKTKEIEAILKQHEAVLKRIKKHRVWKFPDGRIFVQASTTVNWKQSAQNLADLKRLLGIQPEFKEGERREKRPSTRRVGISKHIHIPAYKRSINTSLRDQLTAVGVVEDALRERNVALVRQLELATANGSWWENVKGVVKKVWKR